MVKNYYYADLIDSSSNKPRGDGSFYDGMKTVPMTTKRFKQPRIHNMQKPDPKPKLIQPKKKSIEDNKNRMDQFFKDYTKQCERSRHENSNPNRTS